MAAVFVDLQESCRDRLAYTQGAVEEGIARSAALARAARDAGIPVILVTSESSPEPLAEIAQAAGPGALRFTKSLQSAFTIAPFRSFLEESLVDALVISGWVKSICVRDTMLDAIWNRYSVLYSDEALFHRKGFPALDALMPHERILHGMLVDYYETAADLIGIIRQQTGPSKKARP